MQRKGPASGLFLIYCTSLLHETIKLSVEDLYALQQLKRTQKEALAASDTRAPLNKLVRIRFVQGWGRMRQTETPKCRRSSL